MALQTPPRPREAEPPEERESSRRRGWLPWVAVGVGVVVLIGLAVVMLGPDPAKDEDEQAAGDVEPTQFERDKQAVIATWLAFSRTIVEANDPPNPSHPGLAAYATDNAYDTAVSAVEKNRAKGLALREPPNSRSRSRPEVVSIDGNTAVLVDCAVDESNLLEIATGSLAPGYDPEPSTSLLRVILVRANPGAPWKVSLSKREQRWDGIAGCAA